MVNINPPPIEHNIYYTLISKNSLCQCNLRTREYFLSSRACPPNNDTAKLHFVFNAMAYLGFENLLNENLTKIDLMKLYDSQPLLSYPKINITKLQLEEEFIESEVNFNFKEIVKLIKNKPMVKEDVHQQLENPKHLFGKFKIIGIGLILAAIVPLLLILGLVLCKKHYSLKKIVYALISQLLPRVEANTLIKIQNWEQYILAVVLIAVSIVIIEILWKIAKIIIHKVVHGGSNGCTVMGKEKTKLYLENRSISDKILVHMQNIQGQIIGAHLINIFLVIEL